MAKVQFEKDKKSSLHYENTPVRMYWEFYHQKMNFQMKNSGSFHISAQNIECWYSLEPPRRGGSNEYPQSMFYGINKKSNVYSCKPLFYYMYILKAGFKGVVMRFSWLGFEVPSLLPVIRLMTETHLVCIFLSDIEVLIRCMFTALTLR